MFSTDDTIVAIGTAPGGAARGMVRLSGPQLLECLNPSFQSNTSNCIEKSRWAQVLTGVIRVRCDGRNTDLEIPCELFLWPTRRSYTRQPSAELHLPGSPPLLDMALKQLCVNGARIAGPGEFTMRAFLAGRIDLTRAEAVLGVIDAESKQQLNRALEQLAGGLSQPLKNLQGELIQILAQVEAGLDFVDEDIEFITWKQLDEQLDSALVILHGLIAQMESRGSQEELPQVVLQGNPNAGKSSLFNTLVQGSRENNCVQPEAIVSEIPGTTRDYVTASIRLDQIDCMLVDTAGNEIHSSKKSLAVAAQQAASDQHRHADIRLLCIPAPDFLTNPSLQDHSLNSQTDLILITKSDRVVDTKNRRRLTSRLPKGALLCSSQTGEGLPAIIQAIEERLTFAGNSEPSMVPSTATRCDSSLQRTEQSLERARHLARNEGGMELVATEIRLALDDLGEVAGTTYTEDILDRIFGQFCIGK